MKVLRIILALILVSGFAMSTLNAQAVSTKNIDITWSVFIPCAGDEGEMASGTFSLHFLQVYIKDGKLMKSHSQLMGGQLVGEITGNVYHTTGVTQDIGPDPFTYINMYHLIGPGTQFILKEVFHIVTDADGEEQVVVDKSEVICK